MRQPRIPSPLLPKGSGQEKAGSGVTVQIGGLAIGGPQRAWPYLVQGCESILIAQIRADLILQEVAYCNRGDRSERPVTHQYAAMRGAGVRPTFPRSLKLTILLTLYNRHGRTRKLLWGN